MAELVQEIEDEADLVHLGGFSSAGGLQHSEALAIGVQVKIKREAAAVELTGRPDLGLVGMKRIDRSSIGGHHNTVVP